MKKVIFHIDSDGEHLEVSLADEISFGRTGLAQVVLPDSGLSRLNTTIFRDGDEVFIVDENSTNGTFVNGEQVFDSPHSLSDRDEITIGTNTQIYVEIPAEKAVQNEIKQPAAEKKTKSPPAQSPAADDKKLPLIPILAGVSTFAIIVFAVVAILIIKWKDDGKGSNGKPTPAPVQSAAVIPIRVIDPLGGEDPDDIDDLIAILDNDIADKTVDQSELEEMQNTMTSSTAPGEDKTVAELMVKPEFFNQMIALTRERREPAGESPPGMNVLPTLRDGVRKQTAKLEEMVRNEKYTQPLDFADLAERKLNGKLMELPVATDDYVLDVGGNATEAEFNEFSWNTTPRAIPLEPGSRKYQILQKLAENFGGQKYDLNNPKHRKQMKIRLLRMFNPLARPILMEFAKAYREIFKRPLRITSLTRSMEYQISLNGNNPNSFNVKGDGSRPPHTSGCAFDLARKHMSADEQNFMIQKLAEMENRGILDAIIEYNVNACFHIFIYYDGNKPKGF